MPIYTDRDNWELEIILPDETTPVLGGTPEWVDRQMVSGFSNIPAAQLANRTLYLYNQIQEILNAPSTADDPNALKKAANLSDLADALEARENLGMGKVDNTSDMEKPVSTLTANALQDKVSKEAGKGLSQNDFTNQYRAVLDTIPDMGDAFISTEADKFSATVLMSTASVQSNGVYTGTGGVHGSDWPISTLSDVVWIVGTYGDANSGIQYAKLSNSAGVNFQRSKTAGVYGEWSRVISSNAFIEKVKINAVTGGAGASVTLDPKDGSIQVINLTSGGMTLGLTSARELGDQITVKVNFTGGAWPLTFGANIKLPVGAIPAYSTEQSLTLVFVAMRAGFWDCYFSGVHA